MARYSIRDAYLMFYYKFIKPVAKNILSGIYAQNPISALSLESYQKWMGFAFERFLRRNHHLLAKILGFQGVRYSSGAFYNRNTQSQEAGYQIDLIFERDDHVLTVCEMRYHSEKIDPSVIAEVERKIKMHPNPKKYTIQRILITLEGATSALIERNYFDRIITLADLFEDRYWA